MSEDLVLKLMPTFEGIYYLRDLQYIVRMTRKIGYFLKKPIDDIDWTQMLIESFLLMNSRVYHDLINDLIDSCSKYNNLDMDRIKDEIKQYYLKTLSYQYHKNKQHYRHRAAHGSNYLRVGIIEFKNDVLPMPFNYKQTEKLEYMARIKVFLEMWSSDILQCSNEIKNTVEHLVKLLNDFANVDKT